MKCIACNKKIDDDSHFCKWCGHDVSIDPNSFEGKAKACEEFLGIDKHNRTLNKCSISFRGTVYVPDYVEIIEENAFKDCKRITSVEFSPNSKLKEIYGYAFEDCRSLVSINIPANAWLDDGVFKNCRSLTTVNLPQVSDYDFLEGTFESCHSLRTLELPDNVKKISGNAFTNSGLRSISLPATFKELRGNAFKWCFGLSEIKFRGTLAQWKNVKTSEIGVDTGCLMVYCTDGIVPYWDKEGDNAKTYEEFYREIPAAKMKKSGDFVLIPKETFQMGSEKQENVHQETLPQNYYICDHPVTQKEFSEVFGVNPSFFVGNDLTRQIPAGETEENRPVEGICWFDAILYCNKRSAKEGLTPCYKIDGITDWKNFEYSKVEKKREKDEYVPETMIIHSFNYQDPSKWEQWRGNIICDFDANGYRLPTVAEWEFAARGGDTDTENFVWSGTYELKSLLDYAWLPGNADLRTHEVKKLKPNAYGLYDMCGNVWEMCWDVKDINNSDKNKLHVMCGGCWRENPKTATMGNYDLINDTDRLKSWIGFRVVRSCKG